ncbi:MAG: hypothetical protein HZA09_04520 [Nitrospirae bacterium]|nr:hypothetical protein [Nitrospirota bacterium]
MEQEDLVVWLLVLACLVALADLEVLLEAVVVVEYLTEQKQLLSYRYFDLKRMAWVA